MSLSEWRLDFTRYRRWIVGALAARQRLKARTKLTFAVLIFFLAFSVRALHAVDLAPLMYTSEQPFSGLTEGYDRRAVSIQRGEGILGPYDIDPADTTWITQAPGYSVFLSSVYAIFGRDFFSVQLVQNLVNSLPAVLIFLIAGSIVSWRVGVASGVLAALSHHFAHISNFILPDAMHALPVLAAIYLLILARPAHHAYWLYAAAGLMLGLASWLRAQTMLLGLFLVVMLAIINSRRWFMIKRAAVTAMISLLAIAPITIRNYVVYSEFIPIQVGIGLNLWEGIADASGDRFGAVKLDTEVATQEAESYGDPRYAGSWTTPDGIKRDRDRTRKSLAVILQHPMWYAGVMANRCAEMLKYSAHAPLALTISQASSRERSAPIKPGWRTITPDIIPKPGSLAIGESIFWMRPAVRGLQRVVKEVMLGFIILGAIILFAASRRRALFISIVPLYYFLFQSAMHTEFRYTLPMQYFMFVFAATVWVLIGVGVVNVIRLFFYKKVSPAPTID